MVNAAWHRLKVQAMFRKALRPRSVFSWWPEETHPEIHGRSPAIWMGELTLWEKFCPCFHQSVGWSIPVPKFPCWNHHVGWSLQWCLMKIGADQNATHRNQRGSDPKEQRTNEDLLGYRIGGLEFIDRSWNFSKWHLSQRRHDCVWYMSN